VLTPGAYFGVWQAQGVDPTADLAAMTPLSGGWSGETFLAEAAGERSVVRVYARPSHRGDAAHEVDAALLRLVRGLVPVPEVLEVRRADPAAGLPALLVTSFLPGERCDEVLPGLDDAGLARLGGRLGRLLADLAGMPMLRSGPFVDGDLTIGSFAVDGQGVDGLPGFVDLYADRLSGFSPEAMAGLRRVAEDAQALLDTVGRCCLVHSDFNPKNLLLDPDSLEVTGLLDWEYSHAGHPYTDLGNLLRFDREPAFVEAVLAAYVDRHGGDPAAALDLARAADLWALVDLAARAGENPVTDRAHALLLRIAGSRDVHDC
jgi:aminoglycoside phosphotransferase (APT) family kinase protein